MVIERKGKGTGGQERSVASGRGKNLSSGNLSKNIYIHLKKEKRRPNPQKGTQKWARTEQENAL